MPVRSRDHHRVSHMGTRRSPHLEVLEESHHEEQEQEQPRDDLILQLVNVLQELLGHLGPRQEEN